MIAMLEQAEEKTELSISVGDSGIEIEGN